MVQQSKPYLTTLTPLRGFAALLVVVMHSNLFLLPLASQDASHFISNGWIWVDFFFVLSGFILSYVYGRNFKEQVVSGEYKKYLSARFARIYPLYLVTMIWAWIAVIFIVRYSNPLDPFFAVIFNLKALLPSLFLIQSLHLYITPPLNTPSWSLSTEWWVYMIFPFLVPYYSRLRGKGKLISFILIAGFYVALMYGLGPIAQPFPNGRPTMNLVADFGFFRCLAGFLLGMLILELYRTGFGSNFFKNDSAFLVFFLGLLIAIHFDLNDLLVIAFFPLLILSAAYNESKVKRILDTRPLQRLGDLSFSIYLVHVPIVLSFYIFVVRRNPSQFSDLKIMSHKPNYPMAWISCFSLIILTLIVSSLIYRFVELPAREYLKMKFQKQKSRSGSNFSQ